MLKGWKNYFEMRHEGLGTTYERFILHLYFRRLKEQYDVRRVLEAPVFGMTGISGINSVWWARHGAEVTMVDDNRERLAMVKEIWCELSLKAHFVYNPGTYAFLPFENAAFDMSWNFAALDLGFKTGPLMNELTRVTRKVIFVCLPNRLSLFMPIYRVLLRKSSLSGNHKLASVAIEKDMNASGWALREQGFFDVPPWPDIAMSKADLFRKMGMRQVAGRLEKGIGRRNRICILDYYSGRNQRMKQELSKYAFFENTPVWFKSLWAHHHYLLFEPQHAL